MPNPAVPSQGPGDRPAAPAPMRRFGPTNGGMTGWGGLVLSGAFLLVVLWQDRHDHWGLAHWPVLVGVLLIALLLWATMLRPRILIGTERVLLQGSFRDVELPLVSITDVAIGAFTRISLGEQVYSSPAVGRGRHRPPRPPRAAEQAEQVGGRPSAPPRMGEADAFESALDRAIEQATLAGAPADPVRRSWAVPELAGVLVLGALLLVGALV